ncbi:hypothetical protein JK635_00325 [Neobacillus sp. YIM B02564]|uniref:VCBS repeat-containing protein n=1 Tax=Neobacillus paridis TaxID=2803862 RepID=A0ABS1TI32_9BACI|nr:hypothetical protein [Neobacillus paridis]MBL4950689.1 hypothetical protein [Neobacillus paridis]
MKKETFLAFVALFLLTLTSVVYALEETTKTVTIAEQKADITGDRELDTILLKGVPYQDETDYLKQIFLEVSASNGTAYTIPLESGAKASFQLVDMNDDGVKDLFSSVQTGGSGGIVLSYLHSLKDNVLVDLPVPDPVEIDSHFLNGYQAEIKIKQTGKTYRFLLKDRKSYYKKLGLYYKGKLNEPTELMVNSYHSLKPITLKDGKLGLKGVQRVAGIANADTIAYVESTWAYLNGKWKLDNVKVLEKDQ